MSKKHVAIYNPYLDTRGGGEKVCLAIADFISKEYDVTLISRDPINLKELGSYFSLDLSRCKHFLLPKPSGFIVKLSVFLRFPGRLRNLIHEYADYKKLKHENYDIFINNCYKSNMPCPSDKGVYMCMFPQEYFYKDRFGLLKRCYHSVVDVIERFLYGKHGINIIHTYDVVTVNSAFTKQWTVKLWRVNPINIDILYPICEDMGPPEKKEKIILNVGRFFADVGESHYKCQDKLLNVFKGMTELQKEGWTLHFVGSVAEDEDSLKYLLSLIKSGHDISVQYHFNASFKELKSLYKRASIYWHATGLGTNKDKRPEKQEHFGISTVEAMSAGCIPIVYGSAGQKESVIHNENGFLWNSQEELIELTTRVAKMPKNSIKQIRESARKSSERFGKLTFNKAVEQVLEKLS